MSSGSPRPGRRRRGMAEAARTCLSIAIEGERAHLRAHNGRGWVIRAWPIPLAEALALYEARGRALPVVVGNRFEPVP